MGELAHDVEDLLALFRIDGSGAVHAHDDLGREAWREQVQQRDRAQRDEHACPGPQEPCRECRNKAEPSRQESGMQFVAQFVCAALIVVEKWRQSGVMSRPGTRRATQAIVVVWQHKRQRARTLSYELRVAGRLPPEICSLAPASTGGLPAGATGAVRA